MPGRLAAAIARSEQLRPVLTALLAEGLGRREISRRLAADHGIVTRTGRPLHPVSVAQHLRRLGLQTAYEAGELTTTSPAYLEAKRQGMARAAAAGRNPGLSPGTAAARQRRSDAAAAWREGLRPALQDLVASGYSQPAMVELLTAAGVVNAEGRVINRTMIARCCRALGIRTPRSGPRRR